MATRTAKPATTKSTALALLPSVLRTSTSAPTILVVFRNGGSAMVITTAEMRPTKFQRTAQRGLGQHYLPINQVSRNYNTDLKLMIWDDCLYFWYK